MWYSARYSTSLGVLAAQFVLKKSTPFIRRACTDANHSSRITRLAHKRFAHQEAHARGILLNMPYNLIFLSVCILQLDLMWVFMGACAMEAPAK